MILPIALLAFLALAMGSVAAGCVGGMFRRIEKLEKTVADMKRELEEKKGKEL